MTGVDGVDLAAATEHAVVVANAQTEENIIGMAEATVLLMLAALYDLDGAQDRVRQGLLAPAAAQGQPVARQDHRPGRARQDRPGDRAAAGALGRDLQYSARRDADLTGLPPMPRVDLDTLMRTSDVVVVLASLNDETRGLISADKLRLMKQSAILVNTARGAIVDEAALAEALRSKAIAGAALDCFAVEPLPADSPLRGAAERDPDAAHDRPHHRGAPFAGGRDAREPRPASWPASRRATWSIRPCCRPGPRNGARDDLYSAHARS